MNKQPLLIFLLLCPALVFSQNAEPGYFKVIEHFFEKYEFYSEGQEHIGFARKKDGWHVCTNDLTRPGTILKDQLFWSAAIKRYLPLREFGKADGAHIEGKVTRFINNPYTEYNAYGFERSRYYGYNGWDADMIREFDKSALTNDTLLEGLARAHGAYATRYVRYQYGGYPINNDTLQIPLQRLQMPSNERVQKMTAHFDKAIAAYKKLVMRNPNFETIVGTIRMKYFNECFNGWIQLQLCNREQEARRYLDQCVLPYDDSIAAVNMLQSVDQNGILFTYGDNDTYPLLYLQTQRQIRPDVAVINSSLLALPTYLLWLHRKGTVTFTTPDSTYGSKEMDVALYADKGSTVAQELGEFIASRSTWQKQPYLEGSTTDLYDNKKLYLSIDKRTAAQKYGAVNLTDSIPIVLWNYLTLDEFMKLDIIRTNYNTRGIYFATGNPLFFKNYVIPSGIVYKLVPFNASKSGMQTPIVQANEKYLQDNYSPPFRDFKDRQATYNIQVSDHFALYMPVIEYYNEKKEQSKVNTLVKQCFAPFGKKLPYAYQPLHIVATLCKTNHGQLADEMARVYTSTIVARCLRKTAVHFFDSGVAVLSLQELKKIMSLHDRNTRDIDAAIEKLSDR